MKRLLIALAILAGACTGSNDPAPPSTTPVTPGTAPTTTAPLVGTTPQESPAGVLSEQLDAWEALGITDYDLEYRLEREGGDDSGTYRAVVRDGEPVNCYRDDVLSLALQCDSEHFTVESLFDRVLSGDARLAEVFYDDEWHFPASVAHDLPTKPYTLEVVSFTPQEPIDWVAYVESGVDWLEANYQGNDEVNWESVRDTALRLVVENPRRTNAFLGLEDAALLVNGRFWTARLTVVLDEERAALEAAVGDGPTGRRLEGDLGYLHLPGTYANHVSTYAATVHQLLREIDADPVCGWVVDLRDHSIEDLGREILALGPLLGEGPLLTYRWLDDETTWSYSNGVVLVDGLSLVERYGLVGASAAGLVLDDGGYELSMPSAPVAVLTSGTGGGRILEAFSGRPNTRTFGEPRGASRTIRFPESGSVEFEMPLGASLSYFRQLGVVNRLGEPLDDRPGEVVLAIPDSGVDEVLEASSEWLGDQPSCSG